MSRRWLAPEAAADIGRLDPEAIARVRGEAWPEPANADELHDALSWLGFLTAEEAAAQPSWDDWFAQLARDKRAAPLSVPQRVPLFDGSSCADLIRASTSFSRPPQGVDGRVKPGQDEIKAAISLPSSPQEEWTSIWVAAERLPQFQALWPAARLDPLITAPAEYAERHWPPDVALRESLRGRLETNPPPCRNRARHTAPVRRSCRRPGPRAPRTRDDARGPRTRDSIPACACRSGRAPPTIAARRSRD